jgi:hypothetical protein
MSEDDAHRSNNDGALAVKRHAISLALLLQQQFATQNIAGITRTCRAAAARLSRRPIPWRRSTHGRPPTLSAFGNAGKTGDKDERCEGVG